MNVLLILGPILLLAGGAGAAVSGWWWQSLYPSGLGIRAAIHAETVAPSSTQISAIIVSWLILAVLGVALTVWGMARRSRTRSYIPA